jgi:hypothetical protein
MATDRLKAFGSTLGYKDGATDILIAGLTNFDSPAADTEEIDGTAHDSPAGARENIPGFTDFGEVPLEGYYNPTLESHGGPKGLPALQASKEIKDWTITLPGGEKIPFSGWVKTFQVSLPHDGLMGFTGSIRVTGPAEFPGATGGS